jgi:hypothetical protein
MKQTHYIEFGYGNRAWLSTEIEYPNDTEVRLPGIVWPEHIQSGYLRFWIGYVVIGLRLSGINVAPKRRWAFKILAGLQGYSNNDEASQCHF